MLAAPLMGSKGVATAINVRYFINGIFYDDNDTGNNNHKNDKNCNIDEKSTKESNDNI